MPKKHKTKVNRDAQVIARRERNSGERRVYKRNTVPQDDHRIHLPSEDFFGPINWSVAHDKDGKVIETRQLPVNRNETDKQVSKDSKFDESVREFFRDVRNTVCGRRKTRREVLFAKKRTGKGARKRRHTWNSLSAIICRGK